MNKKRHLVLVLLLLAALGFTVGHWASALPLAEPPPEAREPGPQPRKFQSEADERRFLRAEIILMEHRWNASDWRTGESFAIEAELRRAEERLEELEQRLVETDPVTAIKEQVFAYASWHKQVPISEEEATKILGRPPTGSLLGSWLQSLEGSHYQHVIPSQDPSLVLTGVMQIWYRVGSTPLQYVVVIQYPAQQYLRLFPPHPISPHDPQPYVRLDDGTRVGVGTSYTDMLGRPFKPGWTACRSGASWVSGGIAHSVGGVNLDAGDLLRIIEALSLRKVKVR